MPSPALAPDSGAGNGIGTPIQTSTQERGTMKDLNKMTAQELDSELSRLVHLRTATCRVPQVFEPQGLGFVNDIDGNELAHCTYEDVRDYIVTFDPDTMRGILDLAIDAVSARLDAVEAQRRAAAGFLTST